MGEEYSERAAGRGFILFLMALSLWAPPLFAEAQVASGSAEWIRWVHSIELLQGSVAELEPWTADRAPATFPDPIFFGRTVTLIPSKASALPRLDMIRALIISEKLYALNNYFGLNEVGNFSIQIQRNHPLAREIMDKIHADAEGLARRLSGSGIEIGPKLTTEIRNYIHRTLQPARRYRLDGIPLDPRLPKYVASIPLEALPIQIRSNGFNRSTLSLLHHLAASDLVRDPREWRVIENPTEGGRVVLPLRLNARIGISIVNSVHDGRPATHVSMIQMNKARRVVLLGMFEASPERISVREISTVEGQLPAEQATARRFLTRALAYVEPRLAIPRAAKLKDLVGLQAKRSRPIEQRPLTPFRSTLRAGAIMTVQDAAARALLSGVVSTGSLLMDGIPGPQAKVNVPAELQQAFQTLMTMFVAGGAADRTTRLLLKFATGQRTSEVMLHAAVKPHRFSSAWGRLAPLYLTLLYADIIHRRGLPNVRATTALTAKALSAHYLAQGLWTFARTGRITLAALRANSVRTMNFRTYLLFGVLDLALFHALNLAQEYVQGQPIGETPPIYKARQSLLATSYR